MGHSAPMYLAGVRQKGTLTSGKKECVAAVVRKSGSLVNPVYFYLEKLGDLL